MTKALQPIEQKEVAMYGDTVTAVRLSDGHIYVSVRHMCEALGVNRRPQVMRIQRQEIFAEGYKGGIKLISPGGVQEAGVLRADLVPLWLTGIRTAAVNEDVRPKLEQLQRNAARILWEAFQVGELTQDQDFQALVSGASDETVQAYLIAQAIFKLARQQMILEARMTEHSQRLELLESKIALPASVITTEEASQISQAVKLVAIAQGKVSSRNEFGAVYGEMYRKFGIASYRELPRTKYKEAMSWLNEWYQRLANEDLPF